MSTPTPLTPFTPTPIPPCEEWYRCIRCKNEQSIKLSEPSPACNHCNGRVFRKVPTPIIVQYKAR